MTTKIEKPKMKIGRNPEEEKKAKEWDKSVLGKIGRFVGKAQAPLNDVDETVRWIQSRGKLKTGGPLGYTRAALRDLGAGKKLEKSVKEHSKPKVELGEGISISRDAIERKMKKEPVSGVGIRRKPISRTARKAVRDF